MRGFDSKAGERQVGAHASRNARVLDLGCGYDKVPGAIGLDRVKLPPVDVIADISSDHLPFASDTFDALHANHVFEHIRDLESLLEEVERVCKPGARVHILVPYFTCVGAFGDPTHVRFFTYYTFDHFTNDPTRHTWFSTLNFQVHRRTIGFGRLFRVLGISFFANRWPNLYENFFAYLFPARTLSVEMIVPPIQR